jgi:succinoglycan biosynthesis transport protein ExoP
MRGAAVVDELDLGAVGRALWARKLWVIVPTLLVAALTFAAVNVITPRYKSEARILIEGRENVFLRPEADKLDRERAVVDAEAVASQVQLVLSRDLARKVIGELKLAERPEFDPTLNGVSFLRGVLSVVGLAKDPLKMSPEERALEAYSDRLTAFPVEKSRVIAIEFSSADPELAAQVANTIAETYLTLQQHARQDQTRSASQWLGNEIESLRARVADAEAKVEEFRSRSNLFVGTNNTSLSSQQLAELNSQLVVARSQKAEAEAKAQLIRNLIKSGQPLESADIMNSELLRRLAEQGATLRAQLAEQSSTLLGNHPRIKELKAQIADLDGQIKREAEKVVRALENDARISGAKVDTLNQSLDQFKRQAASSSEQDVKLRALEREAKAQRDLLESYLSKYREASARDSLIVVPTDARIISRALPSNTPAFPKKLPIVLIATLATLLLTAGFITTGQLLAGNVYTPAEEHMLVEPVFAPAPSVLAAAAIAEDRRAAEREQSRTPSPPPVETVPAELPPPAAVEPSMPETAPAPAQPSATDRLASELRGRGEASRRITVIGAGRNIGTTSTAIALARALARDSRVLLIDLALGAPNIAAVSSDPGAPGIAELVRGTASFRHIITRDRASRVHLIAAGHVPADIGAILRSERLAIAMSALARTYEHVVVDAGALPQAALERFAKLAPQAVLVAPGVADEATKHAGEQLTASGFANVMLLVETPPRPDAASPKTAAA